MDPVSIGLAVAVLAGKKLAEKVGSEAGEAGWALANRIIGRVRSWFATTDEDAERKLAVVENAAEPPDSDVADLAALIDQRLAAAPKVANDLAPLIQRALNDPELGPILADGTRVVQSADVIHQTAVGEHNLQVGMAGEVNITNLPPSP